jgi:hypothetical protein
MPELAPSASVPPHRTGRPRDFGGALAALAALLLLNTALGPPGAGRIDYPISGSMTNQLLGLELVTVLLVARGQQRPRGWHCVPTRERRCWR